MPAPPRSSPPTPPTSRPRRRATWRRALIDRLRLDPGRLAAIAQSVRAIAALPDPVGEIEWQTSRDDGLEVGRMRVPLGVIAMIYESRPNVTVDAAALCLKSGNAVILRGGSEAIRSNRALAAVIGAALAAHGLPVAAAALVPVTEREAMVELLRQDDLIDLAIPRGGEGLIRFVAEVSRVPVIHHYKGVCHLYVDAEADLALAERLLVDGKTSRPGVCNAIETLLVDAAIAPAFLPRALDALRARGVELRGCERTRRARRRGRRRARHRRRLGCRVPRPHPRGARGRRRSTARSRTSRAMARVTPRSSSRAIVRAPTRFQREVDASAVMWNASSRFNDGGELGLGAEIGISTTKLHAYGPMGLESLTTRKFVLRGSGQVRHPG